MSCGQCLWYKSWYLLYSLRIKFTQQRKRIQKFRWLHDIISLVKLHNRWLCSFYFYLNGILVIFLFFFFKFAGKISLFSLLFLDTAIYYWIKILRHCQMSNTQAIITIFHDWLFLWKHVFVIVKNLNLMMTSGINESYIIFVFLKKYFVREMFSFRKSNFYSKICYRNNYIHIFKTRKV